MTDIQQYLFRALPDFPSQMGTSKLQLPPSEAGSHPESFGRYMAQFRGSLLALFGEPQKGGDARYTYDVEATQTHMGIFGC